MSRAKIVRGAIALLGVGGALTLTAGSGASAANGAQGRAASGRVAAEKSSTSAAAGTCDNPQGGIPVDPSIPEIPCVDTTIKYLDEVIPDNVTKNIATRSKLSIAIPKVDIRSYVAICPGIEGVTCPFDGVVPFQPGTGGSLTVAGDLWTTSPAGAATHFGVFPLVKVAMLAFGSIPVTADVQLEQTRKPGSKTFDPLKFFWVTINSIPIGTVLKGYEDFGPAPDLGENVDKFYGPAYIRGDVTITISNVHVDGVALDVGTHCSTTAELDLKSRGGFATSTSTGAVPPVGSPGEWGPFTGGHFGGNADIPAFSGCRNSREILDPLITAMVSSKQNHVDVFDAQGIKPPGCFYLGPVDNCVNLHPVFPNGYRPPTSPAPGKAVKHR